MPVPHQSAQKPVMPSPPQHHFVSQPAPQPNFAPAPSPNGGNIA